MIKKGNLVWADKNKTEAKFEENKLGKCNLQYWNPNLFKRFMYWTGLKKDPRYNGKKMQRYYMGIDPYENRG